MMELQGNPLVKTEDLKYMIDCDDGSEREKILMYLTRVEPRNPRLLSEIFLRTVPGQVDRFIARFASLSVAGLW